MILRTGTTLATLAALSTVQGFAPGRHYRVEETVELLAADRTAGVTLVSATLVVKRTFSDAAALITKVITTAESPTVGQITDDAAGDGKGALYFFLAPDDTALLATAAVFEIVVLDSLARETTLDAGAILASASLVPSVTAPTDVASVTVVPAHAASAITHPIGFTADVRDANGNPLLGRVITWVSDSPAIATVDGNGNVTPVARGDAVISATCEGVLGVGIMTGRGLQIGGGVKIGGGA